MAEIPFKQLGRYRTPEQLNPWQEIHPALIDLSFAFRNHTFRLTACKSVRISAESNQEIYVA